MKHFTLHTDTLKEVAVPKAKDISLLLLDTSKLKKCKCSYNARYTFFKEDIHLLNKASKKNYLFAIMSSNAYDRELQIDLIGWKRVTRVISNHGFSADIYTSDDDKKVVIAFRGTDDIKDWKYGNIDTDSNGQYKDADMLYLAVLSAYQGKTILTTGHSLGGGLAIHISLLNKDVNTVVFHPSPRLFVHKDEVIYNNDITIIYEAGEILTPVRHIFNTLRKLEYTKYRYNFLGGNAISEHSIEDFARCMYASIHKDESHYDTLCKKNILNKHKT